MELDNCFDNESTGLLFFPLAQSEVLDNFVNLRAHFFEVQSEFRRKLFSVDQFWNAMEASPNVRAIFPKFRTATISHCDAKAMFDAGATICISGLERTFPSFVTLARNVNSFLGLQNSVEIKAYYSPDGCGLDPHYDPRYVNAVQIFGSKLWKIQDRPMEDFPLDGSPFPLPKSDIQEREVLLKPGTMLSLPPGTVHQASAEGPSLSLNISFEYIGTSLADEFSRFMCRELLRHSFARRSIPVHRNPVGEVGEHNAVLLEKLEAEVLQVLNRFKDEILERHK